MASVVSCTQVYRLVVLWPDVIRLTDNRFPVNDLTFIPAWMVE